MKRTLRAVVAAAGLLASMVSGAAAQPAITPPPAPATLAPAPPQAVVPPPVNERSAGDVRSELNQLLQDYPPTLRQVLRLDPSLLTRDAYLAPYPALAAFVAQHPEIALSPAFYLGSPAFDNQEDPRSRAVRGMVDIAQFVTLVSGFIAFFVLIGWLARLLIDHRRWLRAVKTQTEVHSKLFDRLTSNEDLLAYIQTPAGQQFLRSAPVPLEGGSRPIDAPVSRILWSVQAGTVLAMVGLGLWLTRNVVPELGDPLYIVAVLMVALGVGFALSAGVAYILSLRLGLLESPKP